MLAECTKPRLKTWALSMEHMHVPIAKLCILDLEYVSPLAPPACKFETRKHAAFFLGSCFAPCRL